MTRGRETRPSIDSWASAIARRISDEWILASDFPEDAELLRRVLAKLLAQQPKECRRFIGTGIIEKDYFQPLD